MGVFLPRESWGSELVVIHHPSLSGLFSLCD